MTRAVLLKDQSPLVIKKDEMEDDVVAVCRCGLSAQWPHCDGTHSNTRDESEGTVYTYGRDEPDGDIQRSELTEGLEGADPRP